MREVIQEREKKAVPESPGSTGRVGRPRDPEADRSIIAATLELIAEQGFDGVRVADVADRAGVGKTTMYRRWASKTDLVMAALGTLPPLELPDTGNLHSDLVQLAKEFLEVAESAPVADLLASLASERQREPRLVQLVDPFVIDRMRPLVQVLQRAVARGEVDPEADLGIAASMFGGTILLRVFFGGPVDAGTIERLADMVVRSVEPAAGRR
ncbi:MAG: TetR/AcrR family transcriptional regulator [Deltaproteobacteria bacterium]|jgi:AcrR family transcriptional regulator|nr:TetR/AcrR family transcriptional regulator [Deltaproteobacteria bacterium]